MDLTAFQRDIDRCVAHIKEDLSQIRTGRATSELVEDIPIRAYDTESPVKNLANISIMDSKTICIQPWDKGIVENIGKSITSANLGFSSIVEGDRVLVKIPDLTEERRKEYVKMVRKEAEEGKVAIRNIRKDVNNKLRKSEKDSEITEDDLKSGEDSVQKLTDKFTKLVDEALDKKEKELTTV